MKTTLRTSATGLGLAAVAILALPQGLTSAGDTLTGVVRLCRLRGHQQVGQPPHQGGCPARRR